MDQPAGGGGAEASAGRATSAAEAAARPRVESTAITARLAGLRLWDVGRMWGVPLSERERSESALSDGLRGHCAPRRPERQEVKR
ncbi:hypothetical protein GCM10010289_18170 [Streptomyces violascens]|uniref:Uncharacterized protein n=1 Tax=Streptomyces violascens TaxID=67381 RepID=A0ABQ3R2M2_9ACTN|nr:hypothetical protein GCM10010289_18170 [Streptomyces violascens]GHI43779.1 hypothetical protein Sviol_81870 [Streptomyces violascens]